VLVVEDSRISLVTNFLHSEERKGTQGLPEVGSTHRHCGPPFLEGEMTPLSRLDTMDAEPLFEEFPNPCCETAMDQEMVSGLHSFLAKGALPTIWPTPFL
jgi:hypothetical protein